MKCRLCGRGALEIGGWLERMNETGVAGIWECRPSCASEMPEDKRILGAIEGYEEDNTPERDAEIVTAR